MSAENKQEIFITFSLEMIGYAGLTITLLFVPVIKSVSSDKSKNLMRIIGEEDL